MSEKTVTNLGSSRNTILFVEDEARQLHLMQKILEKEGYRVLGARDGAEAVKTYLKRKQEIALVILDLELPKLSGWDAFQRMKKANPELKAIIATGYVSRQVESSVANGDLSQVILKPYRLDDVLEKISGVINRASYNKGRN